jgi:hypothetical protein
MMNIMYLGGAWGQFGSFWLIHDDDVPSKSPIVVCLFNNKHFEDARDKLIHENIKLFDPMGDTNTC